MQILYFKVQTKGCLESFAVVLKLMWSRYISLCLQYNNSNLTLRTTAVEPVFLNLITASRKLAYRHLIHLKKIPLSSTAVNF